MIVNWDQYYYPCADYEYFNQLYPQYAITEPDCTRVCSGFGTVGSSSMVV